MRPDVPAYVWIVDHWGAWWGGGVVGWWEGGMGGVVIITINLLIIIFLSLKEQQNVGPHLGSLRRGDRTVITSCFF